MNDDWLTDDRGRIASLDVGESANRTKDRKGETVSGSESFLDDRDDRQAGSQSETDQLNLFGETEEVDGQQNLLGDQATEKSDGFFDFSLPGSEASTESDIEKNIAEAESAGVLDPDPTPNQPLGSVFDRIESGGETADEAVQSVESAALDTAQAIRSEYREWLAASDDRRQTVVQFRPSTPNGVLNQAKIMADETRAERQRSQTVRLTDSERSRIKQAGGFGRKTTTASWRSAKGVFEREGLADQFRDEIGGIADYQDPIEGAEAAVERHKNQMSLLGVGGAGAMDMGQEDISGKRRAGRAVAREQQSIESHAIEGAKQGNQEAIDALVFEAGWDRAEAEALAGRVKDPRDSFTQEEFNEIVKVELVRARSNGRFVKKQPEETTLNNFRSKTTGRYVGTEFSEPDIGRNTSTGRFVDVDGGGR